jgi:hypothetical protein
MFDENIEKLLSTLEAYMGLVDMVGLLPKLLNWVFGIVGLLRMFLYWEHPSENYFIVFFCGFDTVYG